MADSNVPEGLVEEKLQPTQAQSVPEGLTEEPLTPPAERSFSERHPVLSAVGGALMDKPTGGQEGQEGMLTSFGHGMGIPTSVAEAKEAAPKLTVKDAAEAVGGPAVQAGKMIYGAAQQGSKGREEGRQEIKEAAQNVLSGQPILPNVGKAAYGLVHGVLQSIPFAGPLAEKSGEQVAAGNIPGAIGSGAAATIQSLGFLKGGEAKPVDPVQLEHLKILEDRLKTAQTEAVKPKTVYDAHQAIRNEGGAAPEKVVDDHIKAQAKVREAEQALAAHKRAMAAPPVPPDQPIVLNEEQKAAQATRVPKSIPGQPTVAPQHAATTIPQEPQEAPQAFTGMRKLGPTGEAGTMGKPLALPEHATETAPAPPEVPQAADVRPLAPPAPATAAEMAGLKAVGGRVVEAPEKAVGPLIKQGLAEGSKAARPFEYKQYKGMPSPFVPEAEPVSEAPKYTKEYADTLVDKLRKSVPDAEISTVGSVKRAGESAHDIDLLASEKDIPSITSAMEKQGFKETAGSSVVSPKEAKEAGKEFPTDQWSRVHHFENEEGHKVEVWHKDTSTEAPKTEPGLLSTEKELKNEGRTPEDLTKVDTVVKELPNQDLIRHGSRFGVDESKYDFSKREATREGGSKHPVEREAHANATVNALPEALKNHIVDAANAWDAKDTSVFDQASRSNESRAERARAIMGEAMKRYQDELASKGQSGGSGAPDKKKLPTGDALIKKYGQSSGDPADTTFILKDGRGVANTGVDHDVMLGGKATDVQPPREQYVQEGTIRVRPRQGTIGGREVSLSIPPSGVTPEQLEYIKKMSPQLRSGAVLIENGERGGDYKVIEHGKATNEALESAINDLGPKGNRLDKQIVEAHNEGGGSSVHPEKGKLQDGYSVGINKELEQTIDKDKITADDVAAYRNRPEVQKALKDNPDAYIGTWAQDGKTYLDTSVHVPDLEAAKKLGADNKQLAIFDLKNKETIDLAKAYKDMTPAEQEALAAKGQSGGSAAAAAAPAKELPELAEKHGTPEELAGATKTEKSTEKFVANMEKIPEVHEYSDIALAGEGARKWYQRSTKAFEALKEEAPEYFKEEGDQEKFINLLAASSPRQSVAMNLRETLRTWKEYNDAGRPTGDALKTLLSENLSPAKSKVPNALKALNGEEMWPDITKNSNFKVPSFAKNLNGWLGHVTNDGWMSLFGGLDANEISGAHSYHPLSIATRAAAEELGWEPAEAQSAIWSFTQALTERGEELPEEVRKHSEDFVDLLAHDPYTRELLADLGVTHANLDAKLAAIGEKPEVSGRTTPTTSRSIGRLKERIEKARGQGTIPPPKSAQGELGFREAPAGEGKSKLEDEDVTFDPNRFKTSIGEDTELRPLKAKKKSPLGNAKK